MKIFFRSLGSKTFQERCERIRATLNSNGIEGEPTMTKCKQLKKQLKLKEEMAGLDPSVIIESRDENDGRPKRTTRTATRRNCIYDEQLEQSSNAKDDAATQFLQKMREFIDSDSEYEVNEHSQNGNNNNNNSSSNDCIDFTNVMEASAITNGQHPQNGIHVASANHEHNNGLKSLTENATQVILDNQSASTPTPQCMISLDPDPL